MSGYVLILRSGTNRKYGSGVWYVAASGEASYTRRVEEAQRFLTREAAQAHACDNERVVAVEDRLQGV